MNPSPEREISWRVTADERELIRRIALRARTALDLAVLDTTMDITACHANGCPLDLERLLAADETNFIHDVAGIYRHLDRETGRLGDLFLPRFAAREEAVGA